MSTQSLPVYMKEPGDQELVIFRGPDEMDVAMDVSIAEAREAEDREDDDDEGVEENDNGGYEQESAHTGYAVNGPSTVSSGGGGGDEMAGGGISVGDGAGGTGVQGDLVVGVLVHALCKQWRISKGKKKSKRKKEKEKNKIEK